jgi:rod shape-determining protein MreB
MISLRPVLGIDIGTNNTLIYKKGKGIVLNEPTVIAIDRNNDKTIGVGKQAKMMVGKTPSEIETINPIKSGAISDYGVTKMLLREYIRKAMGKTLIKPKCIFSIPSDATDVEKRAAIEAGNDSGAKKTYLIENPLAAAIGSGLDISEPMGSMIVDIGGGTTNIAVISLGGVVVKKTIKIAGNTLNEEIIKFVKKKHNLEISFSTAEKLKINVGCGYGDDVIYNLEVKGRYLLTGLPVTLSISSDNIYEALSESISEIIDSICSVLENTPPELSTDIFKSGIVLSGGGAKLKGLDSLIDAVTGVKTYLAENAEECVVLGIGDIIESGLGFAENKSSLFNNQNRRFD